MNLSLNTFSEVIYLEARQV